MSMDALAFAKQELLDAQNAPCLVLGGVANAAFRSALFIQGFKPAFDGLKAAGYDVVAQGDHGLTGRFDHVFICLTKHKIQCLAMVANALEALKPGGILVVAGAVDANGNLTKTLAKILGGSVSSKFHAKILVAVRPETLPAEVTTWRLAGALQFVPAINAFSRPGLYNWDKVDQGSRLLVEHLPPLSGQGADLGAGWGYLTQAALAAGAETMTAFEAEFAALEALAQNAPLARAHWVDVAQGLADHANSFDFVVSNPPFHVGKATDVGLGQAFIEAAAQILKRSGRLIMVANRHLPYEADLARHFDAHRLLHDGQNFKVIEAKGKRS